MDNDGNKAIEPNLIGIAHHALDVENISWTSWTTTEATGSGVMTSYSMCCNLVERYPVTVHLDTPVNACGLVAWTSWVFVFTGEPKGIPNVVDRNGHAESDYTTDLSEFRLINHC